MRFGSGFLGRVFALPIFISAGWLPLRRVVLIGRSPQHYNQWETIGRALDDAYVRPRQQTNIGTRSWRRQSVTLCCRDELQIALAPIKTG